MRYKTFKNAGVEVSELAIGTWAIGGQGWGDVNETDSIKAIHAMIEQGVNFLDTAPIYGAGNSEEIVGRALEGGWREKVLLSTKFSIKNGPDGGIINNGSYENCIKECDESLRRLKTDYIDFYFMHWPDPGTPVEETMRALNVLKQQGKIRFIGVSNFDKELIMKAQKEARIDALQPPYSMINESQKELMQWCETQGIGTTTYGSLGSGILTGAIRQKPDWPADDMRLSFYDFYQEPKFSKVMELLKTLDEIATGRGCPLAQIAINWSTQKSYVGTALCGVRNEAEALENCAAFDWELSGEEMALIDAALLELKI